MLFRHKTSNLNLVGLYSKKNQIANKIRRIVAETWTAALLQNVFQHFD